MPDDPNTRTLPPDPSVPGLWWMRFEGDGDAPPVWQVWQWWPLGPMWARPGALEEPEVAYEVGWRCIAPAVPPEGAPAVDIHQPPDLPPGTHVLVRAEVNEVGATTHQPLVGVVLRWNDGKRRVMHVSVPCELVSAVPPRGA